MIGTAWKGGECPLPPNTQVEVKLRNGVRETVSAGDALWTHYGVGGEVIEYRVVGAKADETPAGWRMWDGGECPVDPDARVEVKLRDGAVGLDYARSFEWSHRRIDAAPFAGDIVRYRVTSVSVPPGAGLPSKRYDENCCAVPQPHSHYHKDVRHLDSIDVYRVCTLFNVTDPCLQHALKKLLVAGGRGAGKDADRDVQEAIDSLKRWQAMRAEDAAKGVA